MILRAASLLLGALLFSGAAPAADLDAILGRIEASEKDMDAVRFAFSQDVRFHQMDASSTVKGRALFNRGGGMRIEKESPQRQITVSNGEKVWVYTPEYNQVWVGPAVSWARDAGFPKGLVPTAGFARELRKNFDLKLDQNYRESADVVAIFAEPKDRRLDYRLVLEISKRSWLPVRTEYRSGSATVMTTFSDYERNPALSGNEFRFRPPDGADVISLN